MQLSLNMFKDIGGDNRGYRDFENLFVGLAFLAGWVLGRMLL